MEGELEQKQNYLRENILEKGYNAEKFMGFLKSKKGEQGLDLNNWDKNELISAVEEFILSNNTNNNSNVNSEEQLPEEEKNSINNKNENQIDIDVNANNIIQEEYITCQKIEPNELLHMKDVDIKLSFPEKVEGGLFSKSYVTYLMNTTPLGYKIRKRYSDFDWLRNILSTIYVNCVIPPLCKKNYQGRFNQALIAKRTRSIEKFMKGVLIHPIMKDSKIFYYFISIEKEEDFEKKKKEYNNLSSPATLNQVKSLTGEILVSINKEKEIYYENIKDNVELNEDLFQKITKSYKDLILLMDQLSEKMKEISGLWKDIYKKNIKYYEKANTTTSYNIMSKVMMDWSEINKKQKILINEGIREYFRYIKNEFHGLKDLALKVENNKSIYVKTFDKLMAQKENLFKQDILYWGLSLEDMNHKLELLTNKNLAFSKMLPFETRKVVELRQTYGFYLNSLILEFERIRILNAKRHKNNIKNFIKSIAESLNDFQIYLNDRGSYYDEIKEEENKVEFHEEINE